MIKTIKILGTCLAILFVAVWAGENFFYKNRTISEPLGWYFAAPGLSYHKNDLVLTCLTNKQYKKVFNQLGLRDVSGQCSDGMPYLLKKVAGVPGDVIKITSSGVFINDVLQPDSIQFKVGRGVALYPLPYTDNLILSKGEYFLLGETTHSVDSRYFGVVLESDIFRRAILMVKTNN